MLEYFIEVQQNTLALGLLLPVLGVRVFRLGGRPAIKRFLIGVLVGLGLAVILATLKAFTGWIVTEYWNMGFMAGILISGLAFVLTDYGVLFRKTPERAQRLCLWAASILGALLVVYVLRADLLYIREFAQADESIFSVNAVLRALGWLGALVLMSLYAAGMVVAARGVHEKPLQRLQTLMFLVYFIYGILSIVQILYAHHMIPRLPWIRSILQVSINQSDIFLYAIILLALVVVVFALSAQLRSLHTVAASADAGENPALRRKARALWRTTRRWSTVLVAGFVITVLSFTVIRAYNERGIELTPAEPVEYVGTTIRIPLEAVEDGHLHRFAHITEEGIEVRFIIIKKNEVAYGVGLDACNVCGATGYYERDDQVVCKMCDVVMNKQTIGFPGGCNPIPFEFTIEDGAFIVEVSLLEQAADHFR
ncbi:MAG: Fe-S-containing protein [Coriobacteriales bacterium]|jgi:uncharacterized membrane protein|nr:Fe-S-containing protein [Coriobacteriales bacterium]